MKRKRVHLKSQGFTLVELLVVIAICSALATLLLPALGNAKFHAANTRCKNNLRQMGLALQLYVTDYDAYPPLFTYLDMNGDNAFEWDQLIEPYLYPNKPIIPRRNAQQYQRPINPFFLCPFFASRPAQSPFGNPFIKPRYGYNASGVSPHTDLAVPELTQPLGLCTFQNYNDYSSVIRVRVIRESVVRVPSQMIAYGDPFVRSTEPTLNGRYAKDYFWRPVHAGSVVNPDPKVAEQSRFAMKTHRARFNRNYCDGHVESEDFTRPFLASDDDLRRWNNDNEPNRERWEQWD